MALQLTFPVRSANRFTPATLATGWSGAVTRIVAALARALPAERSQSPAIATPARSTVATHRLTLPRQQQSVEHQLSSVLRVVEKRQERVDRAVATHRRAAQMVGSIDYEWQCLTRDLEGIMTPRSPQVRRPNV